MFRALHWLIFTEGVTLGLTGMQLGGIWGVRVLPGGSAWAVHVVTGLAWVFTASFFVYYFVVSGDYKWYSLRRMLYSLRFFVAEAEAWLGIGRILWIGPDVKSIGELLRKREGRGAVSLQPHVGEPIRYDVKKGEYVEKIVPTEVVVWWTYVALGLTIGFTGLAMAFPGQFAFVYQISGALAAIFGGGPYAATRAIHRLAMFLILAVAILHAYAAWVFKMLRSITFGDRDEPVAE